MSGWIRIRVSDFYPNAVGENEYTYVSKAVYDVITDTFRREYYAQEMQDLRHMIRGGYVEGETEELMAEQGELAAYYGLRRSEVLGLKWSAIDFQHKTAYIYSHLDYSAQIESRQVMNNMYM